MTKEAFRTQSKGFNTRFSVYVYTESVSVHIQEKISCVYLLII